MLEGLSSLLIAQRLGQVGRQLAGEGEAYQLVLLVASSIVYVVSALWIGTVRLSDISPVPSDSPSGISVRSQLSSVFNLTWGCIDRLCLPHLHWFQPTQNKCH